MAKKIVYALLLLLALALQDTWVPEFAVFGATPDLLLFFVIFTGLLKTPVWGLGAGLLIGLAEDLLSGKYIGLNVLAKGLTGFVIPYLCAKFYKENYLIPLFAVFTGTLTAGAAYIVFSWFTGLDLPLWQTMWSVFLPRSLYNSALTPFIYVAVYLYFIQYRSKPEL